MTRATTALVILLGASSACRPAPARTSGGEATLAELRSAHERLHQQLLDAVGEDPVVKRAFGDKGQVVVAAQSKWIEQVMADVAARYLDDVTLDLKAIETSAEGEVKADSPVGKVTLGDWHVDVKVVSLRGALAAGKPKLAFRAPNQLHIDLPVRVRPARGRVAIRLHWNSAGLANVVCKDFDLARDLDGTVLAQTHTLTGDVSFRSVDGEIVAAPDFPDRKIFLRVDLSPESWATVDAALKTEDSMGRCGALLKPDQVMGKLREVAERGIAVTLPESLFSAVSLPARVEKRLGADNRAVDVTVTADTLALSPQMLWSSASVKVAARSSTTAASQGAPQKP